MEKENLAFGIAERLKKHGYKAFYAGGCVRDRIMGFPPADYDIATDAVPEEIMRIFERTVPVGARYGVVLVVMGGVPFEVSTFRKDGRYIDGRRPEKVGFSISPEEDVKRRDFTINGLFYDPFDGKILDYAGGQDDIKNGVIKAIGDPVERMKEDKLRIMRAVRFACRYRYRIEDGTLKALTALAPEIAVVSPERIRDELDKIIRGRNPGAGLGMLMDTGVLEHILPEVSRMKGVEQPAQFHPEGDVFTHTMMTLDFLKNPSRALAFAALLHDAGKPATFVRAERIRFDGHVELGARIADMVCRRLRFSNEERKRIVIYIENHLRFMNVRKMREAKLKRFMQTDTFPDELELHRADCLASHKKLDNWEFCRRKLGEYSREELKPKPLITGDSLIELGYRPGPLFKEILSKVCDMQLENKLKTKEDALTWVKKNYTIRSL